MQVPLTTRAISYSSLLVRDVGPLKPPVTSTLPFGSSVAVCRARAVLKVLVAPHVPVAGSYSSALASDAEPLKPPATRTVPFGNKVALC